MRLQAEKHATDFNRYVELVFGHERRNLNRRPSDLVQYGRAAKSLFKMTDINRPIWALGRNRANA